MNPIVAAVRSVVQALVAIVVVAVANYLAVELGVVIEAEAITQTISVAVFGVVVLGVNWLGAQFPLVNTLFSLGLSTDAASYEA